MTRRLGAAKLKIKEIDFGGMGDAVCIRDFSKIEERNISRVTRGTNPVGHVFELVFLRMLRIDIIFFYFGNHVS